jgi:hypothetical protein
LLKGLQQILVKVLWHFPLIPWLLCMYKWKSLSELLTWHKDGASSDGLVWCVPNSMSWKHISDKWPNFANDLKCDIRFGTWQGQSIRWFEFYHSTWLVILLNYNLMHWLVTKRYFMMLALIIPRK